MNIKFYINEYKSERKYLDNHRYLYRVVLCQVSETELLSLNRTKLVGKAKIWSSWIQPNFIYIIFSSLEMFLIVILAIWLQIIQTFRIPQGNVTGQVSYICMYLHIHKHTRTLNFQVYNQPQIALHLGHWSRGKAVNVDARRAVF